DTGLAAEQFAGEVTTATVAARTVVQDAGVGLGVGDEIGHAADVHFLRLFRVHDEHVGHVHHERHGFEVFGGIERHFFVDPGVHRVRSECRHAECLAIGRGLGDHGGTNVASGTGTVFDDHRAEVTLHGFGQHAHRDVDGAASRKRNDDARRAAFL